MHALFLRVVVLCVFGVCLLAGWFASYVFSPSAGTGTGAVVIAQGAGVRQIQHQLAAENLIDEDVRFLLLARISGLAGKLRSGEFAVPYGLTPLEVLRFLARGVVVQHPLTIPEGLTVAEIADLYAENGWVDRARFLDLCRDTAFIRSLGLETASLEGYLFPDTYLLARGVADEQSIIATMVKRFLKVWDEVAGDSSTGLDRHQIVTLASIVEKETGAAPERALIARVFLNRLQRGMRLQSDPTVIYGLADFNGDITRSDLRRETPYNTYVIAALPPGPICNPGQAAIAAVFAPAATDALYFVSRNDGTHQFSRTLQEHNQAVRRFQLSRKKENNN